MDIKEALAQLDPFNNTFWTDDGLPLVEVIANLVGDPEVTRLKITEADPEFSRNKAAEAKQAAIEEAERSAAAGDEPGQTRGADTPPADAPSTDQSEEELLTAQIDGINEEINSLARDRDAIDQEINSLSLALARLNTLRAGDNGHKADTIARLNFIKSQGALRAARAQASRKVLQNIDPKQLDPRSPVDQAMSRRTARGTARPVRTQGQ